MTSDRSSRHFADSLNRQIAGRRKWLVVGVVLAAVGASIAGGVRAGAVGYLKAIGREIGVANLSAEVSRSAGVRTVITTLAGGGFSTSAPALSAPMSQPVGVALDPQGRGYYVLEERDGTSLLRFVNTSDATVMLGGVIIGPRSINLLAGGGTGGEDQLAREADLSLATGVAVDPSGTVVYLATPLINSIRAINLGTESLTILRKTIGPGRMGTVYNVSRPEMSGLAISPSRQFYYTGAGPGGSRVVYRLDPSLGDSGTESIFAGGGNPQVGNGDGGEAVAARIINPLGVAVDATGVVFIAEAGDTRNNPGRIRRVDLNGTIGSVAQGLDFPVGVAIGADSQLYVALGNAQQIIRVAPSGSVSVVAGNSDMKSCDEAVTPRCGDRGPALAAGLNLPGSTQFRTLTFAVDRNGIYLPDNDYRRVRFINQTGSSVRVGEVTVAAGAIDTVAGSGAVAPYDNVPGTSTELLLPTGLAEDALGNLYISDTAARPYNLIRYLNRGTTPVTLFGTTPWAMTVQPGQIVSLNNSIASGRRDERITTSTFLSPGGLAATSGGLFIVDSQYGALIRAQGSLAGKRSGHIRFLNTSAASVTLFPGAGANAIVVPPGQTRDVVGRNDSPGIGFTGDGGLARDAVIFPSDVVVDSGGTLYIADQGNNAIRVVNPQTGVISSVRGAIGEQSDEPLVTSAATGIAIANGRLYIADTRGDRILRQDAPGGKSFSVIANAAGGIAKPRDVAVDDAGNVWVANNGTHRILRVTAPGNGPGTVTVVAGTGTAGLSGDGGSAGLAKLSLPNPGTAINDIQYTTSVIVLRDKQIAFTDSNNNRVRILTEGTNESPQVAAQADVAMGEGETRTIRVTANDQNGDRLSFSISGAPGFVTMTDNLDGTASLKATPSYDDAGVYRLTVTASDGDLTGSTTFSLRVNDVNRSPSVALALVGGALEATSPAGREMVLSSTVSDPDGDTLSYQWFNGSTLIASTAMPTVTLGLGNHSIYLIVTDSRGMSAGSAAQSITIQDKTPPAISGVPATIVREATKAEGVEIEYQMPTALDIVDGAVAVKADRPSGSLFPVGLTVVVFTATDSRGNTASARLEVTVTPSPSDSTSNFTISSIAGAGYSGFSGDGGQATNATFKQIVDLGRDLNGNLLIVDAGNRNVRVVNLTTGIINTLAGNTSNGNGGDGGPATFASFSNPQGVVADSRGNIYISDSGHNRVRKVAPNGRIYHFAGSPNSLSGGSGDNGFAIGARLNQPTALAVDSADNLYIVDSGNHRIRMVSVDGIITTVVGSGVQGFAGDGLPAVGAYLNNPSGIAFDAQGNLFIADRRNNRIRRVSAESKMITTVVGNGVSSYSGDNGPGGIATVKQPADVSTDTNGTVFIADEQNHRIRRWVNTDLVTTVAGDGTQGFSGEGGPATIARINTPSAVLCMSDGSVMIADSVNQRVRKLTPYSPPRPPGNRAPVFVDTIASQTIAIGQTADIPVEASDADNDSVTFRLVNAPSFATLISAAPTLRTATLRLAPTTPGFFGNIRIEADDGRNGVTLSAPFSITVTDPPTGNRPPIVTVGAIPATIEATSSLGAVVLLTATATDPEGKAMTYSWSDNGVVIASRLDASLQFSFGSHNVALRVEDADGAVTTSTPQSFVVRDSTPPIISGVPASQTVEATTDAGASVSFNLPLAVDIVDGTVTVTADRASGSIFPVGTTVVRFTATDSRGNTATASFTVTVRPRGVTPGENYTILTIAGTGSSGFAGDGGQAASATFRQITALGRDRDGNLLIVDSASRNVRVVNLTTGVINTLAGNTSNGNGGDGGPAAFASFGLPAGVATDSQGNVYVSDSVHNRVRRISTDGRIQHFAGSTNSSSGSNGDNGLAVGARLNRPSALAVDARDNLYIVDSGNNRVRRVAGNTGIITTVAGTGGQGFTGDGLPGSETALNNPTGVAVDAAGNIYIADRNNHRIRRVDATTQLMTTVAGNGAPGFSGDNGSATIASLNLPTDVRIDSGGNLLIVDQSSQRIRRVKASGEMTTLAGDGTVGYAGDGGSAFGAKLSFPTSILSMNDGTIYIGDAGNYRVRRLAPVTTSTNAPPTITTAIGNQTMITGQTIEIPLAASDPEGNSVSFTLINGPSFATITGELPFLRVATLRLAPTQAGRFENIQVRATDSQGAVTNSPAFSVTVSEEPIGNRPPTVSAISLPSGLEATSRAGALVALSGAAADPDGDALSYAWSDNGATIATSLVATTTLAIGSHSIVLTATDSRGLSASTAAQTVIVRDTTPPTISGVPAPLTVAATSLLGANVTFAMPVAIDLVDGSVVVTADRPSGSLFQIGSTTVRFTATDTRGNVATASFVVTVTSQPGDGSGSYVISTYAGNGFTGFSGDGGPATNASFRQIIGVAADRDGNLLIADGQNRNVRRVSIVGGLISPLAGNTNNGNNGDNGLAAFASFGQPGGVAVDSQGNIYISDTNFNRIRRVGADGRIQHFAGSVAGTAGGSGDNGSALGARLNRPTDLAIDAFDNLYFIDSGNNRIRRINVTTGLITAYAGNGGQGASGDGGLAVLASLNNPSGVAVDAAGNLFIADRGNHRVRRVDAATGTITNVAGVGVAGFAGDNGQASAALLNQPADVAVDSRGNLFIVDQNNHRIRRVNTAGQITTIAGDGNGTFGGDGGAATSASLNFPSTIVAMSDGNIFIGDPNNVRVRRLAPVSQSSPPSSNQPPKLTSVIGDRSIGVGETVDVPLSASDEENDSVTFSLVNGPAFASIVNAAPASRTATLRLAPSTTGTFSEIRVVADDGRGGTSSSPAFTVTAGPAAGQCIASVPVDRWRAEFFGNTSLSGSPILVRDDGNGFISLEPGLGSPGASCGVPADGFSARWSRQVSLTAGLYRFTVHGDDGVRLLVDGTLRLDKWFDQSATRYDVDLSLTAGVHTIVLEYYDNALSAVAKLSWSSVNQYPVIAPIEDRVVTRGQTAEIPVVASDSDNDTVIFTLNNAPAYATLIDVEPTNRRATLRVTPPANGGTETIRFSLSATDGRGGVTVSSSLAITILPGNRPPVAAAEGLPTVINSTDSSGAVIDLDGSRSSDPDGDLLSYSWSNNGVVIATTAKASVRLAVGTHSIVLTVRDASNAVSATSAMSVTVVDASGPPTIISISPDSGRRGSTVTAVVTGSGFAPGVSVSINGGGVTTSVVYIDSRQFFLRLTIASGTSITARDVTVVNPDGSFTTRPNGFRVVQ